MIIQVIVLYGSKTLARPYVGAYVPIVFWLAQDPKLQPLILVDYLQNSAGLEF